MRKKNLSTQTDWSSTIPPRATKKTPAVTKSVGQKLSPPVPPSAAGPQQVHSYKPPQNELDFLTALRSASEQQIRSTNVDLIECVQLRKVEGIPSISLSNGERVFVHETARKFDVDLMFSFD